MKKRAHSIAGAVFDLDGVLTQTAKLHFAAWKETFDAFLGDGESPLFRHDEDYIPYVDGKPRYQGVKAFLESRDIDLPFGDPSDDPGTDTICALGNRKNETFRRLVAEEEVEIYQSTVELIDSLTDSMKGESLKLAVASSSKNCSYILEQTGLTERFDAVVDGNTAQELDLAGKPAADIFLLAAERIGVPVVRCMLVEDAYAGVEAGRKGNFGLVVGVDRSGESNEKMLRHGADLVVEDLASLSSTTILDWFETGLEESSWYLDYSGFLEADERLREALTTVGNGYFGTRGSLASETITDNIHNPGTYIAGLYDRAGTEVHGRTIYNNDFVNCPDWTHTTVRIAGSAILSPHSAEILEYRHWLDLRQATTHHKIRYRDEKGRLTDIETRRFASQDEAHLGGFSLRVTPVNHRDEITIRTSLNGDVKNFLVERYRELNQQHLTLKEASARPGGAVLTMETVNSGHTICMHSRSVLQEPTAEPRVEQEGSCISEVFTIKAGNASTVVLNKLTAIYCSRDQGIEDPVAAAERLISRCGDFQSVEEKHTESWARLWQVADMRIEGDRFAQQAVRLHAYHLLSSAGPVNARLDVGFPARGLHGEAYRGHIFWDELFIMPFYTLRFPEVARSHLFYRYRRLDAARRLAAEEGCRGAMYPWQSADSGGPESQELHYNPRSNEWDPDLSRLQRHISISIAYDIYIYFYTSNDLDFLHRYGMEMLLEIARFWADKSRFDEKDRRYHIEGVMGPDEFHEKYPDAPMEEGGFRDNAYTNIMTAWLLHKIGETWEHLPPETRDALHHKIGFEEAEVKQWKQIVSAMNVVFADDYLLSQFDGYMDLEELDWEEYRRRYDSLRRMDRILKAEGREPDRYKVSKQADTLMIFYLLDPRQVEHILQLMGYPEKNGEALLRRNYDYYVQRTSHGSTLSWIVHAAILAYLQEHKNDQWRWFVECLKSDIYDTQGGTTLEGIHCGVMAASLDIVISAFCGACFFRDHIDLAPSLPDGWTRVEFQIRNQQGHFKFEIEAGEGRTARVYATRLSEEGADIRITRGSFSASLARGKRTAITTEGP